MSDEPIAVPVKRRKRRVAIPARKLQQLNRATLKRDNLLQQIAGDNPQSVAALFPSSEIKPIQTLVDEYLTANASLAESTLDERRRSLGSFAAFIGPRPFTRQLCEEYAASLHTSDFAPRTRWIIGCTFATFLNWLYDTRRISDSWRRGLRLPKCPPQEAREPYSEEEYRKLVESAGERPIAWLLIVGWHTGMSLVDCCDLLWGEVDMENCVIRRNRRKTGVEVVNAFRFGGELHEALKAQQEDTIAAFGSIQPAYPVSRWAHGNKHSAAVMFRSLVESTGMKYRSFHSFRGTLLTDLADSATPLNVSLKVAGLRNVNQLVKYAKTDPKKVREHLSGLR